MTKLEFFNGLKDIVSRVEKNKEYLDTIIGDTTDLLDDYEGEALDEDEEEY